MDFYINTNYRKYPPRNILTINSIKFHNISEDNIISFRLFGNSENKTPIKNIGSETELLDFQIFFYGGMAYELRASKCHLFDDNDKFVVECFLPYYSEEKFYGDMPKLFSLYKNYTIFSFAHMDFFYISEDNDEYDVILPLELHYNETVIPFPEKEIFSTDIYNIFGMVDVSESTIGKNEDNALNIFVNLFVLVPLLIFIGL